MTPTPEQIEAAARAIKDMRRIHIFPSAEELSRAALSAVLTPEFLQKMADDARKGPLSNEALRDLRSEARMDPRCEDEHWWILFARLIEAHHGIAAMRSAADKPQESGE